MDNDNFLGALWILALIAVGASVVIGIKFAWAFADCPKRLVQGIAASGPVCMQARARDVVEADGLCVVGTGSTSVVVHYCRVSP